CEVGSYGFNCNQTCGSCLNGNSSCSKISGQCSGGCQTGWMGKECKTECEVGSYGFNCNQTCGSCLNGNSSCSKISGYCSGGCQTGWMGKECKTECNVGSYGFNCNQTCGSCLNGNTSCSKISGQCSGGCQTGWMGEECKTECSVGAYGYNCNETCGSCLNGNNSCSRIGGQCSGGCKTGWKGETCKSGCDVGTYGFNCKDTCGYCLNGNSSCSMVSGQCSAGCQTGWKDETCKSECEVGTYGFNCNQTCGYCLNGNTSCSKISGQCSGGCRSGWRDETCKSEFQMLEQTSIDVGLIGGSAGSAIAVVALIVIIVVIIVVRRRRNIQQSCPSTGNELSNKKDDVNVYENPSFLNIQLGTGTNASTSSTSQHDRDREIKITNHDSETYYNLGHELQKESIPLSSFWDYVQEHFLDETYFAEEFEKLPSGPQLPMTVAQRSEHRNKNRYKQLYPYDVNRVLLNPMSNDDSDYINASFVDGYSGPKVYIAAQGTTKDNINDFWRMMWQHDVEKIVMLTGLFEGGKHKCELYWPVEKGQRSSFGSVSVRLLDTDVFADYDLRILEMTVGNKSKRLTQFHYTAWPDKGVPKAASSVVQFWRSVNRVPTNRPIVVHCSAGIGRTGTYLALDYLTNQAKAEGVVNVLACVSNLRRQRVNLVQTKEQYIFLHETLVEALMLSGTATSSENFPHVYNELMNVDAESGKIKLQLEYERVQNEVVSHENVYATIKMEEEEDGEESDSKQDEFSVAKKYENRAKNRYSNILPADRHRVYLSTHVPGRNDYINAVIVPSHRQKMGFILTQMPLTDTIIDLWRMVDDHEIRTILMFNSDSSKTCDIGIYWPTNGEVRFGQFSIRLANQERHKHFVERTLSFSVIGDKTTRSIKQFQFTKWNETADIPGNTESFLQLIDAVDKWQKEKEAKPVVVHCINGAERSGLYCVISTVIERLNVERDVAITQTIKRIRAIRQQIIPNYEQFLFCYECVLQYIKMFETYSNF
ncbi:hypothetical protein ACJMK2_032046, partial [Sinanodonta woodiana]